MKFYKKCLTTIFAGSMILTSSIAMAEDLGTLTKKAQNGDVSAQYNLGITYLGKNKPQEALVWFEKAAKKGHLDSLAMMGAVYGAPEFGIVDRNKSVFYVTEACNRGHKKACDILKP